MIEIYSGISNQREVETCQDDTDHHFMAIGIVATKTRWKFMTWTMKTRAPRDAKSTK
jgi:hypothetical protein